MQTISSDTAALPAVVLACLPVPAQLHGLPSNSVSTPALPLISTSTVSLIQASISPSNSPTSSTNSSDSNSLKVPPTSMFKRSLSASGTSKQLLYLAASNNAIEGGTAPIKSLDASGILSPWALSPMLSMAVAQLVKPAQQSATTTQHPSHYCDIHNQPNNIRTFNIAPSEHSLAAPQIQVPPAAAPIGYDLSLFSWDRSCQMGYNTIPCQC
ncbi:hypothetical protein BDQ12DRAFT_729769 [Crucibulum laeve]|uniref:Uncharacterized protein n=1 Tax=Crucibulum laeve TaxID=68775 RepID=A0A5C3LDM7_9AGAR|nr:hypothetical protein BDQ12DRAFT_729769 [Crucibulum laeve]